MDMEGCGCRRGDERSVTFKVEGGCRGGPQC